MNYIVDTGPLVAYFDKKDQWNRWVTEQLNAIDSPLHTCEAVITEVVFLLLSNNRNPDILFDFLDRGESVIKPVFSEQKNRASIREIIQTYHNLPASFADACLLRMYEAIRSPNVFTLDTNFHIYRTSKGKPLSLTIPS